MKMIIIDKKIPAEAKKKLADFGELLELETHGLAYPAISGHPDVFFCQTPAGLVTAPDLPGHYFVALQNHGIKYIKGSTSVGKVYPKTAPFNAVVTSAYLVHNLNITDPVLLQGCANLKKIHVNQGYTRCNLIPLNDNLFITSDKGIQLTLNNHGLRCHYFPPHEIRLHGFAHGFLGGTCGVNNRTIFFCGSLQNYSPGDNLRRIIEAEGFGIIELYDGSLTDVGSLIML